MKLTAESVILPTSRFQSIPFILKNVIFRMRALMAEGASIPTVTFSHTKCPAENWRSSWFAVFGLENRRLQAASCQRVHISCKEMSFPVGIFTFKRHDKRLTV